MWFDRPAPDELIVISVRVTRQRTIDQLNSPREPLWLDEDWDRSRVRITARRPPRDEAASRAPFAETLGSIAERIFVALLEDFALYASAIGPAFFLPSGAGEDPDEPENL
jgi:hypothetical protein